MEVGDIRYAELNFTHLYPPERRGPSLSKRHIRWFSVDNLRFHVQKELPLLVNIFSASKEADSVIYNCTVSSVASKKSWTVSYQYSEFVKFRTELDEQWTCHDPNCSGSCQALRDIVAAYFPKKRLAVLASKKGAIDSRKKKFEVVLIHLLRSVLLPGSVMKCRHARQILPKNVFEFLGVENADDRRSLLQIFVDKCTAENANNHDHSTQCVVCLNSMENQQDAESDTDDDDFDADSSRVIAERNEGCDARVVLPCKHSFHRKCIFQWLLFEFHCPVCHVDLCPNAFTSNIRPDKHAQWWLSDFEDELLPSTAEC